MGDEGLSRNLTEDEIVDQMRIVLSTAERRGYDIFSKPLKVSFVAGGEPLANPYFPNVVRKLSEEVPLNLKISSVAPSNKAAQSLYQQIADIAKDYPNQIQFQVSLNSTDESYRQGQTAIKLADFAQIREMGEYWHETIPNPRKIDLSFTLNRDSPMDPDDITSVLPPELFAIRVRTWTETERGKRHKLCGAIDGQVEQVWRNFKDAGYMVVPGLPGKLEQQFSMAAGQLRNFYKNLKQEA